MDEKSRAKIVGPVLDRIQILDHDESGDIRHCPIILIELIDKKYHAARRSSPAVGVSSQREQIGRAHWSEERSHETSAHR